MAGMNKVTLLGRLGRDPEFQTLENGTALARFPLATSESYKDKVTGEKKELTEWHNLVVWKGMAEVADKYLKKGNIVLIEGKLKTREWEKEGQKHYTTDIVVTGLNLLPQGSGGSSSSPALTESDIPVEDAQVIDDLPF
jgi:single-strand DNA-binding protein